MSNVLKFYGFEFSSASHASPELSSAQSCFKATLTITNIIFLIFGAVLCGVGGYAMQTKAGDLAGQTLPQGIIVLGVFIILVSFLGCVASLRENRFMLAVYFGFLILFVIILLAVGIAVYTQKDNAEKYLVEGWCQAPTALQADIQSYFACCGLYYFDDSVQRNGVDGEPAVVYPACRDNPRKLSCPAGIVRGNGLPCLPILDSTFAHSYITAGACAIAFAVLMAVGAVVVCVLMSGIKEKQHLEDIRKLHRKLREAKEDPAMAGLAGLRARSALEGLELPHDGTVDIDADTGAGAYGEVDLSAEGAEGSGLDHEVSVRMDEAHMGAPEAGSSSARKSGRKSGKAARAQPQPQPEPEEQDEEAYPQGGYAPQAQDEYDDE